MELLDKIHDYLKEIGYNEGDIEYFDSSSVYLSQAISMYAHRNQKRLNGDDYFTHPYRVLQKYRNFVGIVENDYFCLDVDLLVGECNIPYEGVQEVCLLHDVLEDTEITIKDIEELFDELSLGNYFRAWIKENLLRITHDKSEEYLQYMQKVLSSSVSSIVKFMDMADNLDVSTLNTIGEKELSRMERYIIYSRLINDKWHFLENAQKYFQLKSNKKERL